MDATQGSLAHYRMELLIPALYEGARLRGRLRLERGPIRREFEFVDGGLVAERSNQPHEHLAQLLANLRVIDAGRAAAAFEAAEASKIPFGTFLVERGFVERDRLRNVLEYKAREAFFDCYGWQSGVFTFIPGETQMAPQGVTFLLTLPSLHREALARRREWRAFRATFPRKHQHFEVARAPVDVLPEELELVELAAKGATIEDLLGASPDGALSAARRILSLHRREYLIAVPLGGEPEEAELMISETLTLARALLYDGRGEEAAVLASKVLERAAVPEAQRLYAEVEATLAGSASQALALIAEAMRLAPSPSPEEIPEGVTADDLYLLSKLRQARDLAAALRSSAMGDLAAYRSVKRLMKAGLVDVDADVSGEPH